jgi:virginiamycin B lyase
LTGGGIFVEYPLPTAFTNLTAITAGPDGNVWFTETGGSPGVVASDARWANVSRVGRITPSGTVSEYNVSASTTLLVGIVTGPDRNLWVTDRAANKVFRVTISGTVNAYAMPTPNSGPNSITVGPDGNFWITESYAGKLARLTTSGVFTEFKLPTANDEPVSIVAGPDGNLWVTERGRFGGGGGPGKVAKVTTSGDFTEYVIPEKKGVVGFRQPSPGMIVVGPDNNLWFTAADNLDMVTTSGVFTQYVIGGAANNSATSLQAVTAGPGGKVWFTAGGQPGLRPWVGGLVAVPSKV